MPKNITQYDILLSCPGDVDDSVPLVQGVLERFNSTYTDVLGIRLNLKHWSTSSYNQSGGKPQDLLNKQFVHDCDAAIAVFWARFGTKTDRYGSGAEEEIEDMLAAGKQVFMYFCDKPVAPSLISDDKAREQYQKVQDFKKRYKEEGKGIYDTYSSDDEFEKKLFAHITQHFIITKHDEALSKTITPVLEVKGIVGEKLSDNGFIERFSTPEIKPANELIEQIVSLFQNIAAYKINNAPQSIYSSLLQKKIVLQKHTIDLISVAAQKLDLSLPSDFFELGGLYEDITSPEALYGRREYKGTPDEIEKYRKILLLKKLLIEFSDRAEFEAKYLPLYSLKLAVSNTGTTFDEDVDVKLEFPYKSILRVDQLPILDDSVCEFIVKEHAVDSVFGIPASSMYNDYASSIQQGLHRFTPTLPSLSNDDYRKRFLDDMHDAFQYDFFDDGDGVIVKLHVDYIKHNTAVAFPTVLFVSLELKEIRYTICSKRKESETTGTLVIEKKDEA